MLEHRVVFASDVVRITEVDCRAQRGGCGELETETSPRLILPQRGAFAYHFAPRHEVVADANTAIVLHPPMDFKVSHPVDGGDCCTVFEFADEAVLGAMGGAVPVPALAAFAGRVARLASNALLVEEQALACADSLQGAALRRLRGTAIVERAKAELARNPFDDRSLAEIARAVGTSPYHLTRSFKRATGLSLHAYRMQVRLQRGLERAAAGESLDRVALDCGFAHHSHFTAAFRKHFGTIPSQLRKISIAS
ncbi:MAG TPA: AraC family transcriptional regulator [Candidatus Acidoferrales bacterium]|nr:AraC family transcriptional regulator [Candidatus Acidoferrales bacterium]